MAFEINLLDCVNSYSRTLTQVVLTKYEIWKQESRQAFEILSIYKGLLGRLTRMLVTR